MLIAFGPCIVGTFRFYCLWIGQIWRKGVWEVSFTTREEKRDWFHILISCEADIH